MSATVRRRTPIRTPFYYGWLIVAAASLLSFSGVTFFQPIISVFMRPLQDEFGWSRSTIAGAIGVGSLLGAFTSPFVGRALDRWGGRWIMAATGLIMSVCLLALSQIQTLVAFYLVYIVGRTTVVSVTDLASSVAVTNWFVRNRGPAMGIMNFGVRIGQAILPAITAFIIVAAGWRPAFVALAVVVFVVAVAPSIVIVRRRPEDFGLTVDGASDGTRESNVATNPMEVNWQAKDAVKTRAFWLLTFATSVTYFAQSAINLHLVPYMQDIGLSPTTAVSVLAMMSLIGAGGGLLGGFVERRLGAKWTMSISLAGQAAGMIFLIQVHNLGLAYAFAATYGLINGTTQTLNGMIFATFFGRRAVGAIRGLASPVQLVFNATGPFLGGLIYDLTGSYSLAFLCFSALYVSGALAMIFVSRPAPRTLTAAG